MVIMQQVDLGDVDLNLLVPLLVLLEERHVSRAAVRADMSQPAMSRTLSRLRETFGDELLVRVAGSYQLTPRAEYLQQRLLELLPQLQGLIREAPFDAARTERTFRLAGTDYAAVLFGPVLFRTVLQRSPRSNLVFAPWHDDVFDDVARGRLDLVFYGVAAPDGMSSRHLFDEKFVCVVSVDHPLAGRDRLTLEEYLGCSHVVVDINGGRQAVVDQSLSALGVHRSVSLCMPYHAAALCAVPGTRLVATLPQHLAATLVAHEPSLTWVAPPEQIESMAYLMAWHPRMEGDPAHQWLRGTVVAAAATLGLAPDGHRAAADLDL